MAMVSMKIKRENEMMMEPSDECCGPMIYLNEEQCKALGISQAPSVGGSVMIKAKAVINRVSSEMCDEEGESGVEHCICLEITDMELGGVKNMEETGSLLYGKE